MYGTAGALRADKRHTSEEEEEKLLPMFLPTTVSSLLGDVDEEDEEDGDVARAMFRGRDSSGDDNASTGTTDEEAGTTTRELLLPPLPHQSPRGLAVLSSPRPGGGGTPNRRLLPPVASLPPVPTVDGTGGEKLHNPKYLKESLLNLGEVVVEGIRNKPYPSSVLHDSDEEEVFESFFDLTKARLQVIFDTISQLNYKNEDIVDYEHLKRGMAISGLKIDDEVAFARLVKQVDQDLDGGLTFEEFESVVQSLKMAHLLKSKSLEDIARECALPGNAHEPNSRVMDFSVGKILMRSPTDRDSAITFLYGSRPDWAKTRWIDVISPAAFVMKGLAIKYQLHPLALEDALLNAYDQGAKIDRYDNHLFVIFPGMVLQGNGGVGGLGGSSVANGVGIGSGLGTSGPAYSNPQQHAWRRSTRASLRPMRANSRSGGLGGGGDDSSLRGFGLGGGGRKPGDPLVKILDTFPGILHFNVCLFLTTDLNTLITVCDQEAGGHNVFLRVRKELQVSYSRLRSQSALFLMYMVLDVLVDGLLPVMDALEQHIIALRFEVRENANRRQILFNEKDDRDFLAKYHDIIHELGRAKRRMSPAIRLLSHLSTSDPIVTDECKLYLRDVLDHSQEVLERLEGMMEDCRALKAEHQHATDARLTKSMAALSVVSMIFLPGQFLSSVFGMNFRLMPWINDENGYLMFWISVFASWVMMWIALRYYRVF